jgi:hypothetical protein
LAFDLYETAYRLLEQQGASDASIKTFFSPNIPVVLPTFLPNPLPPNESNAAGHIDVMLEVDRFGYSRRIEVVDASTNVPDEAKRSLVQSIDRSRFRPQVADGKLAHRSRVAVRYFVSDAR